MLYYPLRLAVPFPDPIPQSVSYADIVDHNYRAAHGSKYGLAGTGYPRAWPSSVATNHTHGGIRLQPVDPLPDCYHLFGSDPNNQWPNVELAAGIEPAT